MRNLTCIIDAHRHSRTGLSFYPNHTHKFCRLKSSRKIQDFWEEPKFYFPFSLLGFFEELPFHTEKGLQEDALPLHMGNIVLNEDEIKPEDHGVLIRQRHIRYMNKNTSTSSNCRLENKNAAASLLNIHYENNNFVDWLTKFRLSYQYWLWLVGDEGKVKLYEWGRGI